MSELDLAQQSENAAAAAVSVFALNHDYCKTLLYYELDEPVEIDSAAGVAEQLTEVNFKERILQSERTGPLVHQCFVLYGEKRALVVARPEAPSPLPLEQLDEQIRALVGLANLRRRPVPFTVSETASATTGPFGGVQPLLLVTELSENQLRLLAENKSDAIKRVEAKTGLRLKKVKKAFFLTGLLFQFHILNDMLADCVRLGQELSITTSPPSLGIDSSTSSFVSVSSSLNNEHSLKSVAETAVTVEQVQQLLEEQQPVSKPAAVVAEVEKPAPTATQTNHVDWHKLYQESKVSFNIKIKPKNVTYVVADEDETTNAAAVAEDFVYDVYIFQADLTDLNTDALVNANQPDLHPGYTGDGISQRVREKGGKLMSDACKKIRATRPDHLLTDGEAVTTKAFGKLRARYVLHAIEPKWTRHVLESFGDSRKAATARIDRYESLLEQTFGNVLTEATKPELHLRSIAFPCASSAAGGAFDVPLRLLAHVIYTQLVDFPLTIRRGEADTLGTVCITSLEEPCVQTLGDIFVNYTECYSTSSWAIPTSPMAELLAEARIEYERAPKPAPAPVKPAPVIAIRAGDFDSSTSDNVEHQATAAGVRHHRKRNDSSLTDAAELNEFEDAETPRDDHAHHHAHHAHSQQHSHHHDDRRKNHVNGDRVHHAAHHDHQQTSTAPNYVNPLADRLGPKVISNSNNNNKRTRGGFKSNEDDSNYHASNTSPPANNRNRHGGGGGGGHYHHHQGGGHYQHYGEHGGGPYQPQQQQQHQTIVNNRSRQNSNSSSNYSSSYENSGHLASRRVDSLEQEEKAGVQVKASLRGKSCLLCRSEVTSKLVECGNAECSNAFCLSCIVDHLNKQKSQKCPGCRAVVGKEIAGKLLVNRIASTSPTRQQQQQQHQTHPFSKNNTYNIMNQQAAPPSQSHKGKSDGRGEAPSSIANGITQGVIKIRNLADPCEGYEGFESIMVTFDIQDGIQNENHPKPGKPYRGIMKQAYLPKIEGHVELLALYDRALKSGNLFKIGYSKETNEYRVHIDSEITLKTSMRGGGRFGYPDKNYIGNLFNLAKRI